jgi:hypothetical protein
LKEPLERGLCGAVVILEGLDAFLYGHGVKATMIKTKLNRLLHEMSRTPDTTTEILGQVVNLHKGNCLMMGRVGSSKHDPHI